MNTDIILPDSENNGAEYKTDISGWLSKDGRFWGRDERMARWSGATHVKCEGCGTPVSKSYTKCDQCRYKSTEEKYATLPSKPFEEWPIAEYDGDNYFWDADQLSDYCYDCVVKPSDLMLVHCRPECLSQVENDFWEDSLPEDYYELPDAVQKALDVLNEEIRKSQPISYFSTNVAVQDPDSLVDLNQLQS